MPYRLVSAAGTTWSNGSGPTEICGERPVVEAISITDAATPVAKIPTAMTATSRLSLWTTATANRAQTACHNRHDTKSD